MLSFPQGVTYCGESAASSLTMANVPWHEEVVRFVRELVDLLPDYEVACEHEHSNCLLIGHKKVRCVLCPHFSLTFLLFLLCAPHLITGDVRLSTVFPNTSVKKAQNNTESTIPLFEFLKFCLEILV